MFTYSKFKDFIKITTPFVYPDGDVIDIFYRKIKNGFVLTDLGETVRWLESQSVYGMRSDRQTESIETLCLAHNLNVKRDMFTAKFDDDADLELSILEMGQILEKLSAL